MVFHGPGDLRAEELPVPEPEAGELVLRIEAALTCGTDALPWAVESLRDGGTVHYFAGGADTLPLRLETLYHRELTLTATYSSSPSDLTEAFRLIVAGEVSVDGLVTHRVTLPGLDRGVDLMRRREALKVYVTP